MSDAVGTVVEYKQTSQRQSINQKKKKKRERERERKSKPRKLLGQFICALVILVVSAIVFF
jgi:hypothetical protein